MSKTKNMWLTEPPKTANPFEFLLIVSRPYIFYMILAFAMVVLGAIANAGSSYAYKLIVNAAIHYSGTAAAGSALWQAAIIYIGLAFFSAMAYRASGFAGMRWLTGVRATGRFVLTSYVSKHSYQYFSDRFAGSISSKITHAANGVKNLGDQILWQLTGFLITMVTSFAIIYTSNRFVAYVFLAWVVVLTPLNVYLAKKRTLISSAGHKHETLLSGATVDVLTNMTAVHEYARSGFELTRLKNLITTRRDAGMRNWRYGEWVLVANGILQTIFTGSMILLSVHYALIGIITPGDIALTLTLILMAQGQITFIGSQLNQFSDSWGEMVESLEDLIKPHGLVDTPEATAPQIDKAGITLEDVTFNYAGVPVFENLSFTIPAGQRVGLVGRSGAGKSTLIKLFLRHYDLTSGRIFVGDNDISTITQDSLHEAIAVVPQEPLLFHRSILENIAYGKDGATKEDVEEAAKLAQAHDFILRLPEGYNSLVGERGVKLSGGQRQRIAIARALLKNAPLLLLDEATSSLDSESEGAVQKALLTLMEGRTVVAIAHRLSTLRAMDRIIVMENGKIVEDGAHNELLAQKGQYASLWNHQAGGFLED
jgi:ATP-binding cassette subfamily B protein